jgi:polyphosphate kinase 2 (PPK2 family)
MLDEVNLTQTLKKKAYKPVRKAQIERIFDLSEVIYEQKRPVIIVFEGWDAAGKGTTIRQLTAPLDARGFKVLATQAPRTHETRKPWLWRFWMNIPRYGQIAIFDRSWYGRVLVERVNGLTPMPQWIASYEEINNFERTLADDGTIFIKFWLHISKDEQLRRFMLLASEPETAWQVTAEDWENHRKYEEYNAAVRDMLLKTSTSISPWTVVPATDGDFRQYTVSATIITRLEHALGLPSTEWPSVDDLSEQEEKKTKKEKKPDKAKKGKKKLKENAAGAEQPVLQTNGAGSEGEPKKVKNKKKKGAAEGNSVETGGAEESPATQEALPDPTPGEAVVAVKDAPTAPPKPKRARRKASAPATTADADETISATEADHA